MQHSKYVFWLTAAGYHKIAKFKPKKPSFKPTGEDDYIQTYFQVLEVVTICQMSRAVFLAKSTPFSLHNKYLQGDISRHHDS